MPFAELSFGAECAHPIDLAEHIAHTRQWEFNRCGEDKISMAVEGAWRCYSVDLYWIGSEKILQLLCGFEMNVAPAREAEFYKILNLANARCWSGAFAYRKAENLTLYRYGLISDAAYPEQEQIEKMMGDALGNTERFFPAFQLVSWAGSSADDAMKIAFAKAYGNA